MRVINIEATSFTRTLMGVVCADPEIARTWQHIEASEIIRESGGKGKRVARVIYLKGHANASKFFFFRGISGLGECGGTHWELVGYTGERPWKSLALDDYPDVTWLVDIKEEWPTRATN